MMVFDALEGYRSVLEGIQVGVLIVDRERRVVFWNEGAGKITGYLRQEMIGRRCHEHILAECTTSVENVCESATCPLNSAIREGKPRETDLFVYHKQGHRVLVRGYQMPVRDSRGAIIGVAATFQQHQPFNPHRNRELADVGNRSFLEFHLHASLARLVQSRVPFSVLCVRVDDLARFKALHGTKATSQMTDLLTSTIQNEVRDTDFMGWWKEDELLIILSKCDPKAVAMVSERVKMAATSCGIQWWGDRLSVSVAVGYTSAEAVDQVDAILERVNRALCQKRQGVLSDPPQ